MVLEFKMIIETKKFISKDKDNNQTNTPLTIPLIRQVWSNKLNNQKLVTIPKKSNIKKGDYVEIKKLKNE